MNRKINKVNVSIAKTHALVILITIIICTSLWFFISPFSWLPHLNYSHLIIPIAFVVIFKLIVSRLPYAHKEGILRQMSQGPTYFFITFTGVICSLMLATTIHFAFREIITITKIDEIFDYPGREYFFVDAEMGEASSIETSYFTYISNHKGEVHHHMSFLYGGFIGDSKDIFIFSQSTHLYGKEYNVSDEIKKSKFAEKIQKTKMNDFTKNGGYIHRLPKLELDPFQTRITNDASKAHAHIIEATSSVEGTGMFALFSFAFGLLAMVVTIPEKYLKKRNE